MLFRSGGTESYIPIASRTITVASNLSEGGTVSGGGTAEGAIRCEATVNSGYEFVSWTNQATGAIVSEYPIFIDNTAGDKTLVANFKQKTPLRTITLAARPAEGGVVIGGGSAEGEIVCEATANSGYLFMEWINGDEHRSTLVPNKVKLDAALF